MSMNKKEDLRSAIMSSCSNILSLRGSPPLILYTIITIVILLPSACFGETVKVTTLAEVIGNDGNDVVVPCSFTVTPTPSGDQDYVLRWIKYPEGATFYNVYNYNGEGEFDGPVNSPAEGRYTRTNQDLNIPSFTLADQGKLCCEIVLLPDMTATDSNCTQVKYVDFPTDIAWKAVDKKNTSLIVNPDYYITAIPPVTLEVNISYNEIYPPCDLVLYRRTTEGGNDVLTQLDQKLQSQVTAVNGRYSLLMEAKQPVDCTGQDVITRLVARLENCLITSPQYEAEKHFTVVCSETCSPVCENGGTCENGVCQCTQDYTGISCKCRKDNPCVDCDFCMNGGTCINDNGKGLCECPDGWSGDYCKNDACDVALPAFKQGCIKKGQIAVPNAEICECQCENCSPNNCNGNGYPKSLVCNSTTCNRGRCDWKCSGVNCICDEGFCGPTCNTQLKCFNDKSPVRIKGNLTESIEFTARLNSTEGCQCRNVTKGSKKGEKVSSENCLTLKIDELSAKDNQTLYYVQAVKGQCLETLMIVVTVNEPSWNITSDQKNAISVKVGGTASASTSVDGSPSPNSTNFYRSSNHTTYHTVVKRSTDDTSMEDWVQVTNSPYNNKATLMLDSVKPEDAGEYVCIAKLLDYSAIISNVTLIVTGSRTAGQSSQPPPCHSTDCLIIVIVVCVGIALNFFLLLACCCGKKKPSRIDWTDTFIHPCRAVHYVAIIICIILPFVGFCVAIAIFIHIECSKSSGGSKSKVLASPRISPSHLKPDRRPSTANMNKVQPEIEQNGHTAGGAPQAATKYQVSVAPTAPLMPSVATPAWQESPPPAYYGPRLDQPRRPSITNPPRRDSTDSGLHLSVRPALLPNVPSNGSIATGAGGDNDGAAGDGYQGHPLPPPLLGKLEPLEHHTEKKKKKSKKEKRRSKEDVEDDAGKEGNGVANDGYNSIKL